MPVVEQCSLLDQYVLYIYAFLANIMYINVYYIVYYLIELSSNMKSLETNWRFLSMITTISDAFDICSYERVR